MLKEITRQIKSGVPNLDTIISGGFREGSNIILSGPPGTGKSTFCLQYLVNGSSDYDEKGIYVTISKDPFEIIDSCNSFQWNIKKLIYEGKITIIDARPFKQENGFVHIDDSLYAGENIPFEHLTQLILSSIKKTGAKRLVLDSLPSLYMQYSNEFYINQGLQGLFQALQNYKCTSIFMTGKIDSALNMPEQHLASGIIQFKLDFKDNNLERKICIIKMNGTISSEKIFHIKLTKNGLNILE